MFNKYFEREYKGINGVRYRKTYTMNEKVDLLSVINMFCNSEYELKSLTIKDNGDVGMKGFGGEISIEELNNKFYEYYPSIDCIGMAFDKNDVFMTVFTSNTFVFDTPNKDEEINNLIEKKNKQLR